MLLLLYPRMFVRKSVIVTAFAQNAWIVGDTVLNEAVVLDPGGDTELIEAQLAELGLECKQIWLTHSHLDHCGGVNRLKAATGARLCAHPEEGFLRENVSAFCPMFGIPEDELENCPEPEVAWRGGERARVGSFEFEVMHTPGHSPGSLSFYCKGAGVIFVGDVLFQGSIGRTDLPGGDHSILMRSIKHLMEVLPAETVVLPGHGPETTLGNERRTNPFIMEFGL